MTPFDHYKNVAEFVKANWTATPFFMHGEVIEQEPPFIVLDIYPLGISPNYSEKQNVHGAKISCYEKNRGKTHKLISDVQEVFSGTRAGSIYLEEVRTEGPITELETDLYEGIVKFTTRS
ncbi:hypothetical protein PF327_10790 [Sulfurovum sp. XTW-4]|uniref:Tail terminator n=1 Tax=Sulfurovum xiamenensis TaxID=3019066 RepID=A0ABT7QUD1_9BACT|nr:hypothetical protein [Sulfurovum xiamenensis]MDM5264681.1 hypothetical protein [Sulfurovum xiamenensis]